MPPRCCPPYKSTYNWHAIWQPSTSDAEHLQSAHSIPVELLMTPLMAITDYIATSVLLHWGAEISEGLDLC